ncbi:MAG: hypothetical protein LUD81_10345 [Clostridiales bacterium]|nr:hypothetical protein [Clostridiales bacterium]
MKMEFVYELEIMHEYGSEGELEDSCFLGIYSSEEKAEHMIEFFRQRDEYKKYERNCFIISKCKIDRKDWPEGFVSASGCH